MSEDNQILIPPSFLALHADARGRLTVTLDHLRDRYDLCEDLAHHLIEYSRGVHLDLGVAEDEVLRRCRLGLLAPPAQVEPAEAGWIVRRLAELQGWGWAADPDADAGRDGNG